MRAHPLSDPEQYFMWWLFLLPVVGPHLRLTARQAASLVVVWVASQALWLALAYQLELRARNVFLPLWAAGIAYVSANAWILVQLLRAYGAPAVQPAKPSLAQPHKQSSGSAPTSSITSSARAAGQDRLHSAGARTLPLPEPASVPGTDLPFSPTSSSPAGQASMSQALDEALAGKKWRHASKLAD